MPSKSLLPEILIKIFKQLRNPLPPPNGRNERSAIRQHDLSVVMRVSKQFNDLAAPILYSTIITDSLPSLLHGLDDPAVPGVRSKAALLSLMKALYIEYIPKTRPTYMELMIHGEPSFIIADISTPKPSRSEFKPMAEAESKMIADQMGRLFSFASNDGLPLLERYAACAFLGGQPEVWEGVCRDGDPQGTWGIVSAAKMAVCILMGASKIKKVCHRGVYGPLSFPARTNFLSDYFAVHIENGAGTAQLHLGGEKSRPRDRWYFDMYREGTERQMEATIRMALAILNEVTEMRESAPQAKKEELAHKVDMYVPTHKWNGPRPTQRDYRELEQGMQMRWEMAVNSANADQGVRKGTYADDWRWKNLQNAPDCEACGWRFADT